MPVLGRFNSISSRFVVGKCVRGLLLGDVGILLVFLNAILYDIIPSNL